MTQSPLDLSLERGGRIQRDDLAVIDHRDAVAQFLDFIHVVTGEQDGLAALHQFLDQRPNLARPDGSMPTVGSSRKIRLRVVEQGAGEMEALLHPARIGLDAVLLASGQPDHFQQFLDAFCDGIGFELVQFGEIFQVIQSAETAVESLVAAKGEADARADKVCVLDHIQPEDGCRAAGGQQQGGQAS